MKLAFVFPGQGSQSVGMMRGYGDDPVIRATFEEASRALGQDLWQLQAAGPDEALARTVNTQPLMLTADIAVYRAWLALGGRSPEVVAGHSLGEYAALTAAGALELAEAVPLVRFRAQAMQEAVPEGEGAMAAVLGLDDDAVVAACREAAQGQVVEAVNFNAPLQVVIAGHRAAVERGCALAKSKGARRAVILPVSAPFHSSLLAPAAARLAQRLATVALSRPRIDVIHNVDVSIAGGPDEIRDALSRQAASPVRWAETIRRFAELGVTHVAECGPGKVLAGLTKRVVPGLEVYALTDATELEAMKAALG